MSKVVLILVVLSVVCYSEALDSDACQKTPPEKHCLIESAAADRWPHAVRFAYDWYTKKCFEIRWANHCPPVADPPTSNNFPSQQSCEEGCGGWA